MNPAPKAVALLAYPECSASVVFGMYDLFMSAGRDWDAYAGNPPGPQLMQPRIVAAESPQNRSSCGARNRSPHTRHSFVSRSIVTPI